ncbi:hypothetical protein [Streptomyces azureus]|uniref:hypothetical protein n=1 Tax=Streptomyces azureus TaxID=146537 RepID=UPI000AF63D34|nr:hypothetical protein [Streptomyces azureus]
MTAASTEYADPRDRRLRHARGRRQALDRFQPVLPMVPGVPERRSHDNLEQ